MELRLCAHIDELDAKAWNSLAGSRSPFVRHAFLAALEHSGAVGKSTGWLPQHLALFDGDTLIGALPMYLKSHSYGEYVFDWAWADAYARAGLDYYPKLVAAVPFTPAAGPRLLTHAEYEAAPLQATLIEAALKVARKMKLSSAHFLFVEETDKKAFEDKALLMRTGYQFHWTNADYGDFDDFLASLQSAKRKKLRRERRAVSEAGITMYAREGATLDAADWRRFYEYYVSTIKIRGAMAYLNPAFFEEVGKTMADDIVLIEAMRDDQSIAGSLFFKGDDTLYGRYWGAREFVAQLHFETCYYRAIEYCIEHDIKRLEAGAQGEHKLARGFAPTPTYSAHWLAEPAFAEAVSDFLVREHRGIEHAISELGEHLPFRHSHD